MKAICVLALMVLSISSAQSTTYPVGPGWQFAELDDVPWESLFPGDTVAIYWRPQPYRGKVVICRIGTQNFPIVVRGIHGEDGELPIIDGADATTSNALNFWNEERGVIKIGGANKPPDATPEWIRIESLEIRNGRPGFTFTGRDGLKEYASNAAAVYIEKGKNITIRGCILHDCGNGIFAGHPTEDLVIEYCWIYNNGIEGSAFEHNTYTETKGITYQYNHFGSLRTSCLGNNLKDRSAGTVVRYNWIENGNRQLDLVDSDFEDFYNLPIYRSTYVYANILIEGDGEGNSQIVHYGGDSGEEVRYRKGTLFFYNNTVVSTRTGNTTLLRMPTQFESCEAFNNILYVSADPSRFAVVSTDDGVMRMTHNFMRPGWRIAHGSTQAQTDVQNTVEGSDPGYVDFAAQEFRLTANSPCIDAGIELPQTVSPMYTPVEEYEKHTAASIRPVSGSPDIGAYEYSAPLPVNDVPDVPKIRLMAAPNPFQEALTITVWGSMRINVYDIAGRPVAHLLSAERASQMPQVVTWSPGRSVPAGTYLIRASNGSAEVSKRVQFVR